MYFVCLDFRDNIVLRIGIDCQRFSETKPRSTPNTSQSSSSPTTSRDVLSFPDGVRMWHDCPDGTVDVCFVHGLTGNRDSTWTVHGQSAPWPKMLLPLKLPDARLLTYGYDTYVVRKSAASTNRLIDHATNILRDLTNDRLSCSTRRLIFVAHSLGGLVCNETILLSRNDPEPRLRGIFDCVIGILFMGTPHKGSWMADWASIPASTLGLIKSTNKSLLAILESDNQLLESIQLIFLSMIRELRERGRGLDVTCFFEELPLPVAGIVVSKESATLEGYSAVSVHANHREMVRFASAEDTGFKRLLGELVRWESQVDSIQSPFKPSQLSQDCLKSLAFPEMDDRIYDIGTATKGTCEWLFRHDTYKHWATCDRGLLWIKGKPGSGKSTLLRHAPSKVRAVPNICPVIHVHRFRVG